MFRVDELSKNASQLRERRIRQDAQHLEAGIIFERRLLSRFGYYTAAGADVLDGKLFSLGEAALEQFHLRFVAAPFLTRLRDRCSGRRCCPFRIVATSDQIGTPPSGPLILKLQHIAAALSAELNCRIYYERDLCEIGAPMR